MQNLKANLRRVFIAFGGAIAGWRIATQNPFIV